MLENEPNAGMKLHSSVRVERPAELLWANGSSKLPKPVRSPCCQHPCPISEWTRVTGKPRSRLQEETGAAPRWKTRPKGDRPGPHRAQDSGRVLQTRPKSAVGGRSPAHGVTVGDGSIHRQDRIGSRVGQGARTLPGRASGRPYRWLNFTSWIMSSGECSTKCQEHSLPSTWMNLFLKAARPTPESMGMGPRIGNVLSW